MSRSGPELDEPGLVAAVQAGDRAAVSRVLESCLPSLRTLVAARFHLSQEEAEDVLQEVQVAFFLAAPRFRGECSLHTYLVQIACRKCVDYLRARRRQAPYWQQPGEEATMGKGDPSLDAVADRLVIEEAFSCLNPRERRLLDLFYVQAKSYKEIAAAMGLAIGSVGAMKAEALAKLRETLDGRPRPAREMGNESQQG